MTGLTHVRFVVDDFSAMIGFYRDTLGFKVAVDVPGVYVELDTGAARIGLVARAVMTAALGTSHAVVAAGAGPGDAVLQIQVANVDAAAEWCEERGVTLLSAPHDQPSWFLRVAHLVDPAGHLVELTSPLPNPAARRG
ncbi:MAG: VOC family protein [Proteobacteria bacterium]|nr:VOC family protein [Pseudomonadota bacterium]